MGRLTEFSYEHPDGLLSLIGAAGGFTLGLAQVDIVGALAGAFTAGVFTLLIANLGHVPPSQGPHQ